MLAEKYFEYKTPLHEENSSMTVTMGLVNLLGNLLSVAPPHSEYTPRPVKELSYDEKLKLEKILGRKISPKAFACYYRDRNKLLR